MFKHILIDCLYLNELSSTDEKSGQGFFLTSHFCCVRCVKFEWESSISGQTKQPPLYGWIDMINENPPRTICRRRNHFRATHFPIFIFFNFQFRHFVIIVLVTCCFCFFFLFFIRPNDIIQLDNYIGK